MKNRPVSLSTAALCTGARPHVARAWFLLSLGLPIALLAAYAALQSAARPVRLQGTYLLLTYGVALFAPYALAMLYAAARSAGVARRCWFVLCLAGASTLLYGRFIEANEITVKQTELDVFGDTAKPPSLRLALISDIHLGLFQGRRRAEQIAAALDRLDVDAVLIAGDLTYDPREPLVDLFTPFARSRHPIYSVPGNHDEQRPGPPLQAELRAALLAANITPLEGSQIELQRRDGGQSLLVGLGDRWAGKDDPRRLSRISTELPIIVLMHNPDSAVAIDDPRVVLSLAGHTHGGQIKIPLLTRRVLAGITALDVERGAVPINGHTLFVTSGLGVTGLPIRLNQPPVIDLLWLR